ncbi:hybrid sensor histidine kinase/response regulator [Geobacter sp. AOG1]|uniref:hybrid sensor histidine kinase/response regulator n=1 Tax=Geobacter sp. AOG1 TaxID=1566346 RepID=UPI001CC75BF4|nr:hybrid sensor histidine kinase/response regulator [Geobacter sp. AOG1]GFE58259.1 hypothetical protein AOG1_21390 [Geobacter sp. AOG1]
MAKEIADIVSCPDTVWSERETNILVVDDSKTTVELIREAVAGKRRIRLTVAYSLAEARMALSRFQPDLALVDLVLPDGSGIELLPVNREEASFPIVIMTAQGDETEAVKAMKGGALDYLVKSPSILADIPAIIARSLRTWQYIVERRQAVKAVRESEALFRSIFNSAPSGMVLISPEGDFLHVNPANCRLLGYSDDEMLRMKVSDITHPEDREFVQKLYDELLTGQRPLVEFEKRYLRKDGTVLWGHVTVTGVRDDGEKLLYFVAQMQDISARKQAEEALRQSEERFRAVFNTAAAGMVVISPTGEILQANPAICAITGYSESELLHLTVEDITHPEDREKTTSYYGRLSTGGQENIHYEKRYLRKDGKILWGYASLACVTDSKQRPLYCVGLVQDITERKQMEEELRKANRELDAFVYTVSHDLRSPLTPIIGYTEFLREQYKGQLDEQATTILAEIHRQGHRMLRLLEDLLSLAKAGNLARPDEPVDCCHVVEEVIAGLSNQIADAGMTVQQEPVPPLRVPRTLLAQLFDNLIGNALRYGRKEGSSVEVGGERCGALARLYVRDHGAGIPPGERDRVFDLFYRGSNGVNIDGTGVGLATVQKIAHLFGGRAWVEETSGGGSTFWVEILDEERH